MKILSLNFEKNWQNGERQTIDIALALEEFFHHKITILCKKDTPLEQASNAAGFETIALHHKKDLFIYLKQNGKQFDILHPETAQMLTFCALTKGFHKRKIVYTRRLDFVPQGMITIWKYQKADSVVAISPHIERILNLQGIKKTCLIPDMIRPQKLSLDNAIEILKHHNIPLEKKFVIGSFSNFELEKASQVMVDAIEYLSKKRNDFIFVHFANGTLLPQIEHLIKEKNLQNIYFTPGAIAPKDDLFAILNVIALSANEDSSGSDIIDAFMYGVPVASTLPSGITDLLPPSTAHHSLQRGISVPVGDAKQLAIAIDELLSNAAERQFFSENAMKYVFSQRAPESVATNYNLLFESLLKQD